MSALFQPFPMLAGRRAQAWRHRPDFRRPRHFHSEPEVNLVARGSGVLGVGNRKVAVSRGQMLFFEPGQDHELLASSDDFDLFVFALKPEFAERAFGMRWVRSIQSTALTERELSSVCAELSGLTDVKSAATTDERLAELFALAVERAPKAHVQSRRAVESLRIEQDLSEIALARRLGADPSGISRRFRGDLGVTLVEYRARIRLMRFIELADRGEPLIRAALEADFGSYAQCHRVFRRLLGHAPSAYFGGMRAEVDRTIA